MSFAIAEARNGTAAAHGVDKGNVAVDSAPAGGYLENTDPILASHRRRHCCSRVGLQQICYHTCESILSLGLSEEN